MSGIVVVYNNYKQGANTSNKEFYNTYGRIYDGSSDSQVVYDSYDEIIHLFVYGGEYYAYFTTENVDENYAPDYEVKPNEYDVVDSYIIKGSLEEVLGYATNSIECSYDEVVRKVNI